MNEPKPPQNVDRVNEPISTALLDENFDDGDGEFVRWRWPERDNVENA